MSKKKMILSRCLSLFLVSSAFAPGTFAADVETNGDLTVNGVIESSDGVKFPDGKTQTKACNDCVNGVLPISLGGTGGNSATNARTNLAAPGLATPNTFTTGTQTILTGAAANKGLVVQSPSGQTADLQQWKKYINVVASVGSDGDITTSGNVSAAGHIESTGGFKFADSTVQTTAAVPTWSQILPAAQRFALVMASAAVLDKETRLVWQKSTDSAVKTWENANSYCYDLNLGGRKGWRLPSVEELSSLVDPARSNPALPAGHPFTNVHSTTYWSSTTGASYPGNAWYVHFGTGKVYYLDKGNNLYVRCVRGGQ
jgi:hypothetical protein